MAKAYNWPAIEAEYLAGTPLRELSKKFDVPYDTLSDRSRRHQWPKKRAKIRKKTTKKMLGGVVRDNVAAITKIMDRDRKGFGQAADQVMQQFFKYDGKGNIVGMLPQPRVTKKGDVVYAQPTGWELQAAANAVDTFKRKQYRGYGIEDGDNVIDLQYRIQAQELAREAEHCQDLEDLAGLVPKYLQHLDSPEHALQILNQFLVNKERLEHARSQVITKTQFDAFLKGFVEVLEKHLSQDPDAFASVIKEFNALVSELA